MAAKKKKDDAPTDNSVPKDTPETEKRDEVPAGQTPDEKKSGAAAECTADSAKEANEKYLRLLAEYDNYRKRSARERDNIYADVRIDTVTRFLPVYDNLKRALSVQTSDEAYKKGVEMTFNQLLDVMKKLGVEEIETLGKTFDPAVHNAVMHVQDESLGENVIVEEFQTGFKLGEKVIRFSMVKVAN